MTEFGWKLRLIIVISHWIEDVKMACLLILSLPARYPPACQMSSLLSERSTATFNRANPWQTFGWREQTKMDGTKVKELRSYHWMELSCRDRCGGRRSVAIRIPCESTARWESFFTLRTRSFHETSDAFISFKTTLSLSLSLFTRTLSVVDTLTWTSGERILSNGNFLREVLIFVPLPCVVSPSSVSKQSDNLFFICSLLNANESFAKEFSGDDWSITPTEISLACEWVSQMPSFLPMNFLSNYEWRLSFFLSLLRFSTGEVCNASWRIFLSDVKR